MTQVIHIIAVLGIVSGSGSALALIEEDFGPIDESSVELSFTSEDGIPSQHINVRNVVPGSRDFWEMHCSEEGNRVEIPANWRHLRIFTDDESVDQLYSLPRKLPPSREITVTLTTVPQP
ncbi:MAG: hypothetical protein O7D91_16015 [Planctomycetota bacterium]|nr:hypothetical protein [Planctomycetota bacterium]